MAAKTPTCKVTNKLFMQTEHAAEFTNLKGNIGH